MTAPLHYDGYLIWRDATHWVIRVNAWGDQPGEDTARFKTRKAAMAFIDRNPRDTAEDRRSE